MPAHLPNGRHFSFYSECHTLALAEPDLVEVGVLVELFVIGPTDQTRSILRR